MTRFTNPDPATHTDGPAGDRKSFAIVPAAGMSQRMGSPKLLLPWPMADGSEATVLDAVLRAWTESHVTRTVVVIRQDDEALANVADRWPVDLVRADESPREMKESIQLGVRHLQESCAPSRRDFLFVAPADIPMLRGAIVNRLLAAAIDSSTQESTPARRPVTSARYGGDSGHPALLSWSLTPEILDLGDGEGVDRVVKRQERNYIDFPAEDRVSDIDTPETYQRVFEIAKSRNQGDSQSGG